MTLITRNDIQGIKQISDNVPLDKLDPFILEAQEEDLKREMGAALYKAFKDGFTAETAIYVTLMNGEAYTCGNDEVDFPGVKPALAYYTYARYLSDANSYSTVNGVIVPTGVNSDSLSEKTIARKIAQARGSASHYIDEMHKYLCEKSATYPLYKGDKGERKSGKIRISSIG